MKELTLQQHLVRSRDDAFRRSRTFWSGLLLLTMAGSAACMLAGLSISLLSWLQLISTSAALAYVTIGLLFASFSLIFLAAHCLDRVAAVDRANREKGDAGSREALKQ